MKARSGPQPFSIVLNMLGHIRPYSMCSDSLAVHGSDMEPVVSQNMIGRFAASYVPFLDSRSLYNGK